MREVEGEVHATIGENFTYDVSEISENTCTSTYNTIYHVVKAGKHILPSVAYQSASDLSGKQLDSASQNYRCMNPSALPLQGYSYKCEDNKKGQIRLLTTALL